MDKIQVRLQGNLWMTIVGTAAEIKRMDQYKPSNTIIHFLLLKSIHCKGAHNFFGRSFVEPNKYVYFRNSHSRIDELFWWTIESTAHHDNRSWEKRR